MSDILRTLASRKSNGTYNNLIDPFMGSASDELLRLTYAAYADGVGNTDPNIGRANPREVSNALGAQDSNTVNSHGLSNLFTFFGQFLDHDLDLTDENSAEKMSITTPLDDPTSGFASTTLSQSRSAYVAGTGMTPREHENVITSWVDASNIYGSDEAVMDVLRANADGGGKSAYLWLGHGDQLPTLTELAMANPGVDLSGLAIPAGPPNAHVSGDVRVDENIALTSLHTIWAREHNYWVDQLRSEHPSWSEDELFNGARIMVEAEMQNVVWNEWLPLLLGKDSIPDYLDYAPGGYDPNADGAIATEFSTAAFRFGHTLLPSELLKLSESGRFGTVIDLASAFFNPAALDSDGGVDSLLRGLAAETAQELDNMLVDDVRNMLFGDRARDLFVLNVMRGRDHGLPTLNEVRASLGLAVYTDFSDVTADTGVQQALASVYASVSDIDLWVGGLAEDAVGGGQLGETFQTIVLDQFMRLRAADRYYFEHRLAADPDLVDEIKHTTLSDIILRTTGIDYFQDDAFIAHQRISGNNKSNLIKGGDDPELMIGWGGNDKMLGGDGDDDLYGGYGNDRLYGGHGDDVVVGEQGHDILRGGWGDDEMAGGSGRDKLFGEHGDDELLGGGGKDKLFGCHGQDWLSGGTGRDHLWGGADSDTFFFQTGFGHDTIHDLETGMTRHGLAIHGATRDLIHLDVEGFDHFGDILEHARQTKDGVVIELGGGDRLTLSGIKLTQLTDDLFEFH